jgi:hypothetical protein
MLSNEHMLFLTLFTHAERALQCGLLTKETRDKFGPLDGCASYPLPYYLVENYLQLFADCYQEDTGKRVSANYLEQRMVVGIVCNEIIEALLTTQPLRYTKLQRPFDDMKKVFWPATPPPELVVQQLEGRAETS